MTKIRNKKPKQEYERLLDMCYDETVSDEEIKAALMHSKASTAQKVSNGIEVIRRLEAAAVATQIDIMALEGIKDQLISRVDFLKNYYLQLLRYCGKVKVQTARGAMSIANRAGRKPLLIDDENLIPLEFKREELRLIIDEGAIREALERGEEIPGVYLENTEYLHIS